MKRTALSLPLALCLASLSLTAGAADTPADNPVLKERNETAEQHDARMRWFRDARFCMFIHWGLYAQAGGEWQGKPAPAVNGCQEWIMSTLRIPREDYAAMAARFNPVNYDADAWVRLAKDAGMKYIVITSKHHEGFAMFKTAASPYNIVDATPYKKDPLKDLAAACRKHGMKLGFYYSQNLDWYHPGGGSGDWDPTHKGDPEKYVNEIAIPQIREILSNYGDIAILWFDIPGGVVNKERADRIQQAVLACNPNILINNRLGGGYRGDTETPEQHIPATGFPGRDWESCMTMNGTWGYGKNDHNWKSTTTLIHNLCDIASKGGNYLLNVGPTEKGEIPAPSIERLKEIGAWLKVNGSAIYGTRAAVFPQAPSWGRFTTKYLPDGNTIIHAIVFDSPADGLLRLPGLTNKVIATTMLDGSGAAAKNTEEGVVITLPEASRTAKNIVVAVKIKGKPLLDTAVRADDKGVFSLLPRQATVTGSIKVQTPASAGLQTHGAENLGCWTDKNSIASWSIKAAAAGKMDVIATVGALAPGGSVIEIVVGDKVVPLTIPSTGDWDKFQDASAGTVDVPAGTSTVTVRVKTMQGIAPCNLAKIRMVPVK